MHNLGKFIVTCHVVLYKELLQKSLNEFLEESLREPLCTSLEESLNEFPVEPTKELVEDCLQKVQISLKELLNFPGGVQDGSKKELLEKSL